MISPVKPPGPLLASASDDADELIAAVEAMIADLGRLRQRTPDRALLGAYQAAIDRLDALAYRLSEAARPAPAWKPPPDPATGATPQGALPLGPVVVARKPRRR
jgi:hypothetical protein